MSSKLLAIVALVLAPAPLLAQKPAEEPPQKKQFNPLDEDLKQSLGEGQDVGAPEDPLMKIGERMRSSEELIGKVQVGEKTQELQRQIIADLDRLIQQAQQGQQGSSSSSKPSFGRRNSMQQPQRSPSKSAAQPGNGPARDSTDQIRPDDLRKAQMGEVKKSLGRLWGDLPERAREEAIQALGDTFLPKYDLQIRKFFERLGEDGDEKE